MATMPPMNRTLVAGAVAGALLVAAPVAALAQTTPLPEGNIPAGVSISGIDVSGLTGVDARGKVLTDLVAAQRAPLMVAFKGKPFEIDPDAVGYKADVDAAVITALQAVPEPGATVDVPLAQTISRDKLTDVLKWRDPQVDVAPVDAAVSLRANGRPVVRKATLGFAIDVPKAAALLAPAFVVAPPATAIDLPAKNVAPSVTSIGPVVVVTRRQFKLRLYRGTKLLRTYPVAVGQPAYPTPSGNYKVIEKQVDPTWFPPSSPWAAGLGPIPPGSGNPLGTRWIGTSAPGIGIHGTPNSASIGSAASHGCIRMYISDVENLYPKVQVGTPVFIR